jgi:5-methylcytosine-specific restriction endonuclease McrA
LIGKLDSVRVFLRNRFLDRYTGDRPVFPPVLRLILEALPE